LRKAYHISFATVMQQRKIRVLHKDIIMSNNLATQYRLEETHLTCLGQILHDELHWQDVPDRVFLVNVNLRSHSLYAVARSSVVRLQRSCVLLRRLKFSAMFLRHLAPWPSVDTPEIFTEIVPWEPSVGGGG